MIETLIQFLITGIVLGSIYGLIGVGFSVVHSATGAINFAQGEFVVLGAFMSISLVGVGIHHPLAIVISPLILSIAALIVYRIFLQRVSSEPLYLVVATIALSLILRTVALYFWGREPLGAPSFFKGKLISVFGLNVSYDQVLIFSASVVFYFLLLFIFSYLPAGKAMKAVVEEREIAMSCGLNPQFYQSLSFSLGAFLGAFSGCILAPVSMLSYFSGGLLGLKGFASAVFAGLEHPQRVIFGGLALGILEAVAVYFVPSGFKDLVALVVLLFVLTFKPEGFFADSRKRVA